MNSEGASDPEVEIIDERASGETETRQTRSQKRQRDEMPMAKSPQKRVRKNSIGGGSTSGTVPPTSTPNASAGAAPGTSAPPMDPGTKDFLTTMQAQIMESIAGVNLKVKANSDRISEVSKEMSAQLDRHKKETKDEIDRIIKNVQGSAAPGVRVLTRQQEDTYDICRRSLRMWPIRAPNYAANVRTFLMNKLQLQADILLELGTIDVKRYFSGRPRTREGENGQQQQASGPVDEVIVTFATREARDKVKAAGYNLAGQNDAGLRIHVPGFLMDSYNALQSLGYHMKQKEPEVRRSVKFDDAIYDLVMDIKIGDSWKRITAEQGREIIREDPAINSGPERMSTSDIVNFLGKKK